jgi:hypothetical protein
VRLWKGRAVPCWECVQPRIGQKKMLDVGVHSVVLGDAGEVAGHFDSRNHVMVTCVKRVCGLASGDVVRRDVSLLCHDGGQRK